MVTFTIATVARRQLIRRDALVTFATIPMVVALVLFDGSFFEPATVSERGQALADDLSDKNSESRFRVVIPSLADVENKLKFIVELSPDPRLQKQWKKLKHDMIDAYTDGVDEKSPLSVEIVFSASELSYNFRIPISNFEGDNTGFLQGLRGRGYRTRVFQDGTYELLAKGKKPIELRYDKNYAWVTTGSRPVPTNLPAATTDLQPILSLRKDVVAEIKNDTEGSALRSANFRSLRTQWEHAARKRRRETSNAFEFRKVWQRAMLNQAEALLVEAQQLLFIGDINVLPPRPFARGEIFLTALPGTDLFKMIAEFGVKPGYFQNVTLHDNPILVAKLSIPLDAIRIDHLNAFFKSVRPILESEITIRSEPRMESQKRALIRATNAIFDMMDERTQLRSVDAFFNLFTSPANKCVLVCGMHAADGKRADEIFKLIQEIRSDWQLRLNVHEVADVSIHELIVGPQDLPTFQQVFGVDNVIYLGTGPNAVWAAVGAEGLIHLKTAIQQSTTPLPEKADSILLSYQVRAEKLVSLVNELRSMDSPQNSALTPDEMQTRKLINKYFTLVRDATVDCESSIAGELRRIDNAIEGYLEMNECTLKCIGTIIASLVNELE